MNVALRIVGSLSGKGVQAADLVRIAAIPLHLKAGRGGNSNSNNASSAHSTLNSAASRLSPAIV